MKSFKELFNLQKCLKNYIWLGEVLSIWLYSLNYFEEGILFLILDPFEETYLLFLILERII